MGSGVTESLVMEMEGVAGDGGMEKDGRGPLGWGQVFFFSESLTRANNLRSNEQPVFDCTCEETMFLSKPICLGRILSFGIYHSST